MAEVGFEPLTSVVGRDIAVQASVVTNDPAVFGGLERIKKGVALPVAGQSREDLFAPKVS